MTYGGYALKLKGQYGPGPGFTAFRIGLPLTVLSAIWLVQLLRQWKAEDAESFESERGGLRRIATVLLALVAFGALLLSASISAPAGAAALSFFAFDRDHAITKIVIALVGSFGVDYRLRAISARSAAERVVGFSASLGFLDAIPHRRRVHRRQADSGAPVDRRNRCFGSTRQRWRRYGPAPAEVQVPRSGLANQSDRLPTVAELPCFVRVSELPEVPELVILAIPANA